MIAGDREHVWPFLQQDEQRGIELFKGLPFRGEISVFSMHVRSFVVDEKEIVAIVFRQIALKLFGDRLRPFQFRHADQLRQTFIHGIDRQTCRAQTVSLVKAWYRWLM